MLGQSNCSNGNDRTQEGNPSLALHQAAALMPLHLHWWCQQTLSLPIIPLRADRDPDLAAPSPPSKSRKDPGQVYPNPPPCDRRQLWQKVNQTQTSTQWHEVAHGLCSLVLLPNGRRQTTQVLPTPSSISRDRTRSPLVPGDYRIYQKKYLSSCRSSIPHPHLVTPGNTFHSCRQHQQDSSWSSCRARTESRPVQGSEN